MLILILLLLLISSLFLFWTTLLLRKKNNYWKKRGIPGPKPSLPFKGNIDLIFGKNPSSLQLYRWSKIYGNIYGIKNGWINSLIISEPKMVKELLFDKFDKFNGRAISPMFGDVETKKLVHLFAAKGKRWKRLRTIANPAFSISNLKRIMPIINDSIKINIQLLKEAQISEEKYVDLNKYSMELAFDIISRVAMGQKESKQFKSESCQMAQDAFKRFNNNIFEYFSYIFPWLGRNVVGPFVTATGKLRGDPLEILIKKIEKAVKQRKEEKIISKNEENKKWTDFIDLFLESENNDIELKSTKGIYNKNEKFERCNIIEEIVFSCSLFLLAGFDTTANTLSLISHNLVMYPNVQKKLFEEIEEICGLEEGEMPTYEQLSKLKYIDAIFNETQRLCPIASAVVNRVCEETTTLGNITIEKGIAVSVDLFTLHRDKNIWGEDAEQFKPERWLNEEGNIITPSSSFYPFGGGPRICIGMRLGIMEIKMILVQLLRTFELKRCSKTEVELNLTGQVVLNPGTITVELILRK